MAWNEPGGSGDKDPWGGRGQDQGPPDLDQVVKRMQERFSRLFKGKRGGGGPARTGTGSAVGIVIIVVLAAWALSGIYIVDPAERGVVLRFGQYSSTSTPGPHWHIPFPIERVEVINVDEIHSVEVGYRPGGRNQAAGSVPSESLMLTQDENIIDIQFAVQYRVKEAKDYLFNVREPDLTLRQATESAVREVIGKSRMDFILTQGRSEVSGRVEELIQGILDTYNTGLVVTSVNMQSAQPPKEVKAAFDDAIKAREDEQRLKNEAEAYANDVIPRARGAGARLLEEANAYRESAVAQAEGEAERFEKLLSEYRKAPNVTRERLYIETMQSVLGNTSKILVDVAGGNNLLYLPIDKIVGTTGEGGSARVLPREPAVESKEPALPERSREGLRLRERP